MENTNLNTFTAAITPDIMFFWERHNLNFMKPNLNTQDLKFIKSYLSKSEI